MSASIGRDLLKAGVLRTNPYWPFRSWNRWPYAAAQRRVVRVFGPRPEIRSIYLRGGVTNPNWVPGLSDIDLTFILRRGMAPRDEYCFVRTFWKDYTRLQRFFPMLGEVEILDEDEIQPRLASTAFAPGPSGWKLLHGDSNAQAGAHSSRWPRRALNLAIYFYEDSLLPLLGQPDSFLVRRDVERRVRKILRLLSPVFTTAGLTPPAMGAGRDSAILAADAISAMEAAVALVTPSAPEMFEFPEIRMTHQGGDRSIWIIPNGLDRAEILRRVRIARQESDGKAAPALLLPRRLFQYIARHYDPYRYADFTHHWVSVEGQCLLDSVPPPARPEFEAHGIDRLGAVLTFARSHAMASDQPSLTLLERELNRVCSALAILGSGAVPARWEEAKAQWRTVLPEYSAALETLKASCGTNVEIAENAFYLFRSVAKRAGEQLSNEASLRDDAMARAVGIL